MILRETLELFEQRRSGAPTVGRGHGELVEEEFRWLVGMKISVADTKPAGSPST
jgi:hypothetical protein